MRHLFLTMILALLPSLVLAQAQTTGRIIGKVVDEAGQPIADAEVRLGSPSMQGERVAQTDAHGQFLAALLPVGAYKVTISSPGRGTVQVSLRVGVGRTDPISVILEEGEIETEIVTVLATASPLETPSLGESFNFESQIDELPLPDRRVEVVALLAPNVDSIRSRNELYLSVSGAAPTETSYLLDGAEITDGLGFLTPTVYLEDAIEEVQVQSAGVSARYGRFMGGVINVVTKTGGNQFRGTLRADFTNASWNSRTPFGEDVANDLDQTYQATLGGYFSRDRLWFFLGGRAIPASTTSSVTRTTLEPFSTEQTEDRWQARLRGAITEKHSIDVNYLDYETSVTGADWDVYCCLAGDLPANGIGGRFPRDIFTLAYQGVLGPSTFIEALGSRKNVATIRGSDSELGSPFFAFRGDDIIAYRNNAFDQRDPIRRDNETLGFHLTRMFATDSMGSHELQTGVEYVNSMTRGASRWSVTNLSFGNFGGATPFVGVDSATGDPLFNVNATDQVNLRFEDVQFDSAQEVRSLGIYAHDRWQLRRWRFDLGLRWENYDAEGAGGTLQLDTAALAPRLGVAYEIQPSLQMQASLGKYVGRLDDSLLGNQTGVLNFPQVQSIYVGPTITDGSYDDVDALLREESFWFPIAISNPNTPRTFISESAELSYAIDYNLGVRWAFSRNRGVGTLTLVQRDYENIWDGFVGGLGVQEVPVPGREETFLFDTIIWADAPQAERQYRALVLTGDYRPRTRWGVGGNWTLSELTGNASAQFDTLDVGDFGTPLGAYERSRPDEAAIPTGSLLDDITNRVNMWADYRLELGRAGWVTFGALGRYRSGHPWSRTAQVRFAPDPLGEYVNATATNYTRYFDGRGNNRFDDWWSLDLSAWYEIPTFRSLNVWVKGTVSNVFGNSALVEHDITGRADLSNPEAPVWVPDPAFGQARGPNDYQTPRAYQISVGLRF